MYHWRASLDTALGPVDLAFTDRYGGASAAPYDALNLALEGDDDPAVCAANLRLVADDLAPGATVVDMRQVHGNVVDVVEDRRTSARPEADADDVGRQPDDATRRSSAHDVGCRTDNVVQRSSPDGDVGQPDNVALRSSARSRRVSVNRCVRRGSEQTTTSSPPP